MLLRICIVITALAFAWSVAAVRITPTSTDLTYPGMIPRGVVEEIQPGMTYEKVRNIVGHEPSQLDQFGGSVQNNEKIIAYWKGANGTFITASFLNNELQQLDNLHDDDAMLRDATGR